jgi:hypothetical protein
MDKIKKIENWINYNLGWFFCPPTKQGKEKQNSKWSKTK